MKNHVSNNVSRRCISLILSLAIVLSCVLTYSVFPTAVSAATPQATYYVSPTGSDSNDGTQANPFKTLAKAKEAVQALPKSNSDIVVEIADGFYPLDETLVFDEKDSGNVSCTIRYVAASGANPVISGGKMLEKGVWEKTTVNDGVEAYKTTLDRNDKLRAIYVNGVRSEMTKKTGVAAKSADSVAGYYKVTKDMGDWAWRNTEEIVMDSSMNLISSNGHSKANMIASTTLPVNAKNPRNIEFETGSTWVKQRICIDKLEQGTDSNSNYTVAYFQMPFAAIAQSTGWGTAYGPTKAQTICNVFEWLSKPGEFYFDQEGKNLYYIPRNGDDMNTAEVVVPELETLIEVQGSQPKQSYAQYISFEGLTFAHSDWNLSEIDGSRGNATPQGATVATAYSHGNYHYDMYRAYDVPAAAIHMTTAHDIKLLDGQVMHTGSLGVHIENDVFDIAVTGNNISYTGGAGLVVGHPTHIYENDGSEHQVTRWVYPTNTNTSKIGLAGKTVQTAGPDKEKFKNGTEGIPHDILVTNNFFNTNCLMFPSHNTITTFYTRRLQVLNNFVFNSTYGGMNIGWGWCNFDGSPMSETDDNQLPNIPTDTSKENTISYNRVENVCTQLADSGGIYTLGKQGDSGYINASNMSNNYINVIRDLDIWKANKGGDGNSDWVNGFHPDEGSAWIKFNGNVVENVIRSVFEFNTWKRKHDMQATNTYSNKPNTQNGAPGTSLDLKLHEDSIWPVEAYETILKSGLQDKYKHWIPESVISKADLEFTSSVRVDLSNEADGFMLKKGGMFSAEDEVWFLPEGTDIGNAQLDNNGETMTMTSGKAETIAVPSKVGIYELYVKHQDQSTEKSKYKLYVGTDTEEPAEPEEPEDPNMVKAHYGTPNVHTGTIDDPANIDEIWNTAETVEANNFVEGSANTTGAAIGTAKTLWDENNLYVLFDVQKLSGTLSKSSSQAHQRDAVEIFIEEQNSRDGSYQSSSGQYRIDYENARTYGSGGSSQSDKQSAIKSATYVKPDGSGYIVEAAIPFTTTSPAALDIIGFDAQVNGADGSNRASVAIWNDLSGSSWSSTSKWGSLLLVKPSLPTTEGMDLWLMADKGVKTDVNGKVTGWTSQVQVGGQDVVLTPTASSDAPLLKHETPAEGPEYDYIQFDTYANRLIKAGFTSGGGSPDKSKYEYGTEMTVLAVLLPETTYAGLNGDISTLNGDRHSAVNLNDVYWGGVGLSAGSNAVVSRFGHGSGSPSPTVIIEKQFDELSSVMIMKSGETDSIYVNGKKRAEESGKGSPLSGVGNTLTIGGSMDSSAGGQNEPFKGRVAEVLIYDHALSQVEMENINAYILEKYLYNIIPVEGIQLQANSVPVGESLELNGTVTPAAVTFKDIVWSIADDGGTGATINNGTLSAPKGGTVTVTATIKNGKDILIDYTKNFKVTIVAKDYVGSVKDPEESSKTHTSVALTAVDGYEYACVPKNGAVPTVFVAESVFTGLMPNMEYDFYQRVAKTDSTKASNVSAKITVETDSMPDLAGTVTFEYGHTGAPLVGDKLTVAVNSNNSGKLGYIWYSDDELLGVNSSYYNVVGDDLGKVIKVKVISSAEPGELTGSTAAVGSSGSETILTGMLTIDNMSPKVGDKLTASLTGSNNTGTLSYKWFVGGVSAGTGETYAVKAEDVGNTIKVTITSSVETGKVESAETAPVVVTPTAPIKSIEEVNVTTMVGKAPVLPGVVTAVCSDNSKKSVTVKWKVIAEADYAKAGTFKVEGTVEGTAVKAIANITVLLENIAPTDITLDKSTLSLKKGEASEPLKATVLPANATNRNVIWSTSDSYVAAVDNNGVVTAKGKGTATITATTEVGSYTSSCTVTVTEASDSGSGSGSSSSGGGSSSSSTSTTTPVVTSGKVIIAAPVVDTAKGTATVTVNTAALTKALTESKLAIVEIPKTSGVTSYVTSLPASTLASGEAAKAIQVVTELGTVIVPLNMLTAAEVSGAAKIELSIGKADTSNMDAATKAAVGDKPVIELNLKIDGTTKLWSNLDAPVKVTIPYTPTAAELANPEHITVWYIDEAGKAVATPSARYDAVTGKLNFTTTNFNKYAVVYVNKTFEDIDNYTWAKDKIEVMASKGIIGGTSDTTFTPGNNITRADFMLLLVKALGLNAKIDGNFDDVVEGSYYYNALAIAKKLGITTGVGDNKFDPKANISRQDMMVLAEKAMRIAGKDLNKGSAADVAGYKDAAQVSGYAQEAVAALVKEGIITGSGNKLNPKQTATRAETAVIIYKLYNK